MRFATVQSDQCVSFVAPCPPSYPGEQRRFNVATARQGLDLAFQHTTGNILRFKVVPAATTEAAAPPAVEAEPMMGLRRAAKATRQAAKGGGRAGRVGCEARGEW